MHRFRVTKYDPAFRTAAGAYAKDDWTSFSDVGRSFLGVTLNREEYLRVESAYVEAAVAFMTEDRARQLRVVGLEIRGDHHRAPVEGSFVSAGDLAAICQSILRGAFWCKLEADDRFVHFGRDYYMYLGVLHRCEGAISKAKSLGLFVEDYVSPYLEHEEEG